MALGKSADAMSNSVVETASGKVSGKPSGSATAFLGIHYAKAQRFQPPQPVSPWRGIRECTQFGPNAPQSNPAPPSGPPPIILAQLPRPEGAPRRQGPWNQKTAKSSTSGPRRLATQPSGRSWSGCMGASLRAVPDRL